MSALATQHHAYENLSDETLLSIISDPPGGGRPPLQRTHIQGSIALYPPEERAEFIDAEWGPLVLFRPTLCHMLVDMGISYTAGDIGDDAARTVVHLLRLLGERRERGVVGEVRRMLAKRMWAYARMYWPIVEGNSVVNEPSRLALTSAVFTAYLVGYEVIHHPILLNILSSICFGHPSLPRIAALYHVIRAAKQAGFRMYAEETKWYEELIDVMATRGAGGRLRWGLNGTAEDKITFCIATVWQWLNVADKRRYAAGFANAWCDNSGQPLNEQSLVNDYESWRVRSRIMGSKSVPKIGLTKALIRTHGVHDKALESINRLMETPFEGDENKENKAI